MAAPFPMERSRGFVYQREFYTANLLLWWHWLLVVPVLIASLLIAWSVWLVRRGVARSTPS